MNILGQIVEKKKQEVAKNSLQRSVLSLETSPYFYRNCFSLVKNLLEDNTGGIIAEIKRKSPALGVIHKDADILKIAAGYVNAGASGLSILTDTEFFGGSRDDLINVREKILFPILRKDFIIDEYQVIESKSIGADVILLIANILSKKQVEDYSQLAHEFGMEVLLEVHNEKELSVYCDSVDIIGVNNRNLKTFTTSLDTSYQIAKLLPASMVKISESGIKRPEDILSLKYTGYHGFLIGETFMKQASPETACQELIAKVRKQSLSFVNMG